MLLVFVSGCMAYRGAIPPPAHPFVFEQDTFAFPNELKWEYFFDDDTGKVSFRRRDPPATYGQRCFVLARSTKQFHQHARFDPKLPVADEATYCRLVGRVVSRWPSAESSAEDRIVIPGYANLRTFSQAWETVLKEECGGAWQSYIQPSHWRMILPFSRRNQARMARQLVKAVRGHRTAVVHIVRFPSLAINHAIVLYGATVTDAEIRFEVYDPNDPQQPLELVFKRSNRTFYFPRTLYFAGGPLNVNEVFRYRPPGPVPFRAPRQAECQR